MRDERVFHFQGYETDIGYTDHSIQTPVHVKTIPLLHCLLCPGVGTWVRERLNAVLCETEFGEGVGPGVCGTGEYFIFKAMVDVQFGLLCMHSLNYKV